MTPEPSAGPFDLEGFRRYLLVLARIGIDPKLRRRVSASDIVQETLLEAHRALPQFRGSTVGEQAAWVRRILANNLANAVEFHGRERRDLSRERSIEAVLERSSVQLGARLRPETASPSGAVMKEEAARKVIDCLAGLPETQVEVVVLHYVHGWTLAAVADHLSLTRYRVTRELRQATTELQKKLRGVV